MPRTSGKGGKEAQTSQLSDEFLMYNYKVLPCGRKYPHDWASCPCGHKGERAARRDIRRHPYVPIACHYAKQKLPCPQGDACLFAHSLFEYWLHPARFRTEMCQYGSTCERPVCFFAHTLNELRMLDKSLPPAELCWSGGASINRAQHAQHAQHAAGGMGQHYAMQHPAAQAAQTGGQPAAVSAAMTVARMEQDRQLAALAALAGGPALGEALTALTTLPGGPADAVAVLRAQPSLDAPAPGLPPLPLLRARLPSVPSLPLMGSDVWGLDGDVGLQKCLSGGSVACGGTPTAAAAADVLPIDWKPWGRNSLFDPAPGGSCCGGGGGGGSIGTSGLNADAPVFSPRGSPRTARSTAGPPTAPAEPLAGGNLLRSYAAANAARDAAALLPLSLDVELAHDSKRLRSPRLASKLSQLHAGNSQAGSPTIPAAGTWAAGTPHVLVGGGGAQHNAQQLAQMISALPEGVVASLISLLQSVNVQQA